jgi:hypothetical protein
LIYVLFLYAFGNLQIKGTIIGGSKVELAILTKDHAMVLGTHIPLGMHFSKLVEDTESMTNEARPMVSKISNLLVIHDLIISYNKFFFCIFQND